MAPVDYKTVGFIGLGNMGYPMLENLIAKMSQSTKFYVFDVSSAIVEQMCSKHSGRVESKANAKEVTEQSVRLSIDATINNVANIQEGSGFLHGP